MVRVGVLTQNRVIGGIPFGSVSVRTYFNCGKVFYANKINVNRYMKVKCL